MKLSRRNFLACAGLLGTATAGLAASDFSTSDLESVYIDLSIPDLPTAFDGYRVGLIADLHIGLCSSPELTHQAISRLNRDKVDLLLLGGDYILRPDQTLDRLTFGYKTGVQCEMPRAQYSEEQAAAQEIYRTIADVLAAASAPDGVLAVYGNHDLWVSPKHCSVELGKRNLKLLVNESQVIERGGESIEVFGADDYWAGIPRKPAFRSSSSAKIVIAHNPDYFSDLLESGHHSFHLGVAGHSHGGQIRLPLIGAPFCNLRDTRFICGLVEAEHTIFYTSRGIGTVGLPVRINCRPEVTVFTLKRA